MKVKRKKKKFVSTRALHNGMEIGQSIRDRRGRVLIQDGIVLDDFMIEALPKLGINGVYVYDGEVEYEVEEKLSKEVECAIERNTVEDRARVRLTESVKKRVAEGIQYIYSNSESKDFLNVTNTITSDLMKAINDNKAIAVDIDMLKVCDEYTFKHSVDVATMAMIIAKQEGLPEKDIHDIGISGLLHDVGKSRIPNELLNKPGRLTDEEFGVLKQHPVYGYDILKNKNGISEHILLGVVQHHEKMNGAGYPFGVKSEKIAAFAKIIAVADIYDALVTERSYKRAFSKRDAVEMIMAMTEELDYTALRSFMASVILYPVGSTIKLSNGEWARVVENHPECILRPTVVGLTSGEVYNLAEDLKYATIIIE